MSHFDAARAAEYDRNAAKSIIGHEALYEVVMKVLAGHGLAGRVLILGAGTGKETLILKRLFPQTELIAVDPSEPMLEVARQKLAGEGLQADVRCGYLEDFDDLRDLDAVVMIGVLHHLPGAVEQEALMKQLGERIRPGGLLVLGTHVGPLNTPLRSGAWKHQWRELGAEDEEIAQRLSKVLELSAPTQADLDRWLEQFGFTDTERVFSSLFFEVWACERG